MSNANAPAARAYYNECEPFAAAWLRELIADNLIAPGDVDDRSIEDVTPNDLQGYTQCHFFAGIGVWSLALRLAGWPDHEPVWTGSCPCQPFSGAGKGGGFADKRHLWPAWLHLIRVGRPGVVFGEQVSNGGGLAWLDLVQADMEGEGYASAAVDICAAGFGAPHIRQRLYWLAVSDERKRRWLANGEGGERDGAAAGRPQSDSQLESCGDIGGLADAAQLRLRFRLACDRQARLAHPVNGMRDAGGAQPRQTNGFWRAVDWLLCRDSRWRPVEPGSFPLADARTIRNRVAQLRGAGNALNLAQAVEFIAAARAWPGIAPCP